MSTTTSLLGQAFLTSTLEQLGTNEEAVFEILHTIRQTKANDEFEKAVAEKLGPEATKALLADSMDGQLIPAILREEMSGAQLKRALDIYKFGAENHSGTRLEYFIEGTVNTFDLSSSQSKLFALLGIAAFVGLATISAPAAAVVGTGIFLTLGVGRVLKNSIEVLVADSEYEVKENLRDLGAGVTTTVLTAPFLPKGIEVLRPYLKPADAASKPVLPPQLVLIEGGKPEFPTYSSLPGPDGIGGQIYSPPPVLGNTVFQIPTIPSMPSGPVARLTLVPAPASEVQPALVEIPLELLSPLVAPTVQILPMKIEDGEGLLTGVTDPERFRQKVELNRRLARLNHLKQRIEEMLGYSISLSTLDQEIKGIQNRLIFLGMISNRGALSIQSMHSGNQTAATLEQQGETKKDTEKPKGEEDLKKLSDLMTRAQAVGLPNPLLNADPKVRQSVVEALGDTQDQAAVLPLLEGLARETDIMVRLAIIRALGKLKSPAAIPHLKELLGSPMPAIVAGAINGMLDTDPMAGIRAIDEFLRENRITRWSGDGLLADYFDLHPEVMEDFEIFMQALIVANQHALTYTANIFVNGSPTQLRNEVRREGERAYERIIKAHPELLEKFPGREIWIFSVTGDYIVVENGLSGSGYHRLGTLLKEKLKATEAELNDMASRFYVRSIGDTPASSIYW